MSEKILCPKCGSAAVAELAWEDGYYCMDCPTTFATHAPEPSLLSQLAAANAEIERLKGLIRWFHNRHEDLLEIDDEDGCVDYDAPEKAAIAKIGKEKP